MGLFRNNRAQPAQRRHLPGLSALWMTVLGFFLLTESVACSQNAPSPKNQQTETESSEKPQTQRAFTAGQKAPDVVSDWDGTPFAQSEEAWKAQLSDQAYYVLRQQGTERAFTGAYHDLKADGTYVCAGCGLVLFRSGTKFDSGTGWPSFYQPEGDNHVGETQDNRHGMRRTEVHCNRCGGHLGHVFPDGPRPTGLRYCINSVSLLFVPTGE
jgi:peptide-methionine (R)-S-oxide reductase